MELEELMLEVNRSVFYLNELRGGPTAVIYPVKDMVVYIEMKFVNSHITMLTFRASLMLDLVESRE